MLIDFAILAFTETKGFSQDVEHPMKDVFQPAILNEILSRIETLTPTTQRLWGKMDVAQMMAHCSEVLKVAVGDEKPPRAFIGKIIGGFMKPILRNEKPFAKNSPTDPIFKIIKVKNFTNEKAVLIGLLKRFAVGGETNVTTHPHPFFGKLTPAEWSSATYKHLNHHLQQFGC